MADDDQFNVEDGEEVDEPGPADGPAVAPGDVAAAGDAGDEGIDEDDLMEVDEETLGRMMATAQQAAAQGDQAAGGEGEDDDFVPDFEPLRDDAVARFTQHGAPVYCLACSPVDGDLVASGGGDDRAFLWHRSDPARVHELSGHADSVTMVAFSSDGKYLASGALDGSVRVWAVDSGALVCALDGPSEVTTLFWHPRGPVLVACSRDATAWMWQLPAGTVLHVFAGHYDEVLDGAFTPDGKTLVTCSADCSLIVWAPKTGQQVHRITGYPFHEGPVHALALSPDGATVLSASLDGTDRKSVV